MSTRGLLSFLFMIRTSIRGRADRGRHEVRPREDRRFANPGGSIGRRRDVGAGPERQWRTASPVRGTRTGAGQSIVTPSFAPASPWVFLFPFRLSVPRTPAA